MNFLHLNILYSIIPALLFVLIFHKPLKKHPYVFYAIAILLGIGIAYVASAGLVTKESPWLLTRFWNGARKAVFATCLMFFVMYAPVLPKNWGFTKIIKKVRGELAIFSTILILAHNLIYLFAPGYNFLMKTLTDPDSVPWYRQVAMVITIVMMVLLIILAVTSLPEVRKKIGNARWKSIHKLAYVFYGLLYCHLAVLYLPKYLIKGKDLEPFIIYTIIFGVYAILRISLYLKTKKRRSAAAAA